MATNVIDKMAEMEASAAIEQAGRGPNGTDRDSAREAAQELVLAPLVDKVAYGLAKVLVVAMQGLEQHIASETRNVAETLGRRLDMLQASVQDLSGALTEQRSISLSVQDQCRQLEAATASLRETDDRQQTELAAVEDKLAATATSLQEADARQQAELAATAASLQEADARQQAELAALRSETAERIDALLKELGVHQEDIAAFKSTLCEVSARVDTMVERLDRQAEALRSMYAAYSQRETELEQLVDGLARLRAYPAPAPASKL